MTTVLVAQLAAVGVAYIGWRVFWRVSPLDSLPGPPSTSFLTGECCLHLYTECDTRTLAELPLPTGNLRQYIDRNAWEFHREVAQNYGPVVKMHSFFNVRLT